MFSLSISPYDSPRGRSIGTSPHNSTVSASMAEDLRHEVNPVGTTSMRKVFLTAGGNPGMAPAIACTVVFAPDWWRRHYGIAFDAAFYFDRDTRIRNDVQMRRALYERFEIGEPDPQPRPVIGSLHVAGGFVVPALLGVEIRFAENQAPWPVCAKLSLDAVRRLRVPDIETTWPFQQLIADMDALERDFGCVVGDFNPGGILNTALDVRGNDLFID